MIIDSHCHSWLRWPYQPPVPDPEHRGRLEQLIFQMDQNGVDKAVIICANIADNLDNNADIAGQAPAFAGRIIPFADIDSRWQATYRSAGAAARLRSAVEQWNFRGFTHYLADSAEDDGSWLVSADGEALFAAAEELGLIASISAVPHQMGSIAEVARRHPDLPILLHHLGRTRAASYGASGLRELVRLADLSNIHIKISGFGYAASPQAAYPYDEVRWLTRSIAEFFGPSRMCWGSDFPVVQRFMTYRQSLDIARDHCRGMPDADFGMVFGDTLNGLLTRGRHPTTAPSSEPGLNLISKSAG